MTTLTDTARRLLGELADGLPADENPIGWMMEAATVLEAFIADRETKPLDMSEEEFMDKYLSSMMGGWVPIERYLKLYPEETRAKIHSRVKQKGWQRRVHYAAPKGGSPWINLPAVLDWLRSSEEPEGSGTAPSGPELGPQALQDL